MADRQLRDNEIEDSKNAIELSENVESQARMSDPALKVLGDERVVVTEEDVSRYDLTGTEGANVVEQEDSAKNR